MNVTERSPDATVIRGSGAWWHWCTRKRECPQGHPYNRENTYVWRGRKRICKTCNREQHRRRYWAAKGDAA